MEGGAQELEHRPEGYPKRDEGLPVLWASDPEGYASRVPGRWFLSALGGWIGVGLGLEWRISRDWEVSWRI